VKLAGKRLGRSVGAGLAAGVLSALVASGAGRTRLAQPFENSTYDLRVRHTAVPVAPSSPVVIVAINESSVRALEPIAGRWPWPRMVHASAIDYLARAGARVIAYDVLFSEHEGRSDTVINGRVISGQESDAALVDAVGRAGNVVLLADATYEGAAAGPAAAEGPWPTTLPVFLPGPGFFDRPNVHLPFESLAGAAAGIGHNYLEKDPGSGAARRMLPFVAHRGAGIPSLGVAAALAFARVPAADVSARDTRLRLGGVEVPLTADPVERSDGTEVEARQMLLRFPSRDRARETSFPTYSFFDVLLSEDQLDSGKPPAIPASAFAGKLVFVGTTASGLYDRVATPLSYGAAGVELHGIVADNILSGRFMRRAGPSVDFGVTLALSLVAGLSATLLPVAAAVLLVALSGGVAAWALAHQVAGGVWVAEAGPALGTGLALLSGISWRYVVEGREKRQIRRMFSRYVSKDVVAQLIDDPSLIRLGGQRRDMTVLFSDIRGFTSASEKGTPEAVVAQLNEYFGAMVEVLFRHQGTLDKFVGDMVMGLFGAPLDDPAHADHAVATAIEMTATLDRLNARWQAEGQPALNIGIGINTGEMIAGNIGSADIMSYTVIGDAVNLGARLESLNKDYGTRILISETTRARLSMPPPTRAIGEVVVKGRTQPVMVYEVCLPTEHER
jgi:adenylate cyclase